MRVSCAYTVLYLFPGSLDIVVLVSLWSNAEVVMILTDRSGGPRLTQGSYKKLGL
jgi:hypothetical protein